MKASNARAPWIRRLGWALVLSAGASLTLSGCAYQELKAPCARDEGAPVTSYAQGAATPEPFASMDHCGALRPLNRGDELGAGDGGLHRGE